MAPGGKTILGARSVSIDRLLVAGGVVARAHERAPELTHARRAARGDRAGGELPASPAAGLSPRRSVDAIRPAAEIFKTRTNQACR